jgi:thioesterase domain-containing protein/acyl carrier protein
LSFDVSIEEILPTLIVGARLVVMGTAVWRPAEFNRRILEFGLTVLNLPSAYWQELARQWSNAPVLTPHIQPRLFIVGGDTMFPEGLNLWQRTPVNSVRLVNAYGPTETTITATAFEVIPRLCEIRTFPRIPIGRPLANREVYILDKYGNPVPVGVCGELYIGGAGLARGYLNRPELTAEKFVPNPFSEEPGARLYKTGDLGRYLPDGNIEFLGRVDQQVKIRGFRIELEEIEAALGQYPAVREAVVLARQDAPGEKRLVAYVVADQESRPTANDLRSFLKEKLPEHMVPVVFVQLNALPLMANGKVDRRALPVPDRARRESEKVFVAPRDELELQLTGIWEEVLGVRPIGVRDNFFELGGHSLLAARLFASIENRLGKKLPLAAVFQGATVEHLADILRQDAKPAPPSSLVAIQPGGSKRPLFLVHPAGGHVFPYVHLARYLGPDQPCYGLQAKGLEEGEEPHARIEDMATEYVKALRTVQANGPYHLGGWSMGGLIAFEMAQQLHAQGERVDILALLDTRMIPADEKLPEADLDATLLADFFRYFGLSLDLLESFAQLPKDQALTQVLELAQSAGLVPPEVEISQAHRFVELLKSDFHASRNYELHRYPGRVTLFKASEELAGTSPDPTLGWREWASAGVDVHLVPGNHANMVYQPQVELLAEKLRDCLNHAQSADDRLTRSLSTDPLIKEAQ